MVDVGPCPYCGSTVSMKRKTDIGLFGKGDVYCCDNFPDCDAYVSVHAGTDIPMGTLANQELRSWRAATHDVFDPLHRSGRMSRTAAYKLMMLLMNLSEAEAHIGRFTIEQCQTFILKLSEMEAENVSSSSKRNSRKNSR